LYLATVRTASGTRAVKRIEEQGQQQLLELGYPDLRALLTDDDGLARAAQADDGDRYAPEDVQFVAPVTPDKVVCVRHNYGDHIKRLGLTLPQHPRLSTKFASSIIGPYDPIAKPADAHALDCAVELVVVIGRPVRHPDETQARAAIAGFTVINDVADRDLEFQAEEWGLGNIWDGSSPLGPYLVTPDELPGGVTPTLTLTTTVDGREVQRGNTADLHFSPVQLVQHVARFMHLNPGDVIASGSPSAPSHDHGPEAHLREGQQIVTAIEGIGECRNTVTSAGPVDPA